MLQVQSYRNMQNYINKQVKKMEEKKKILGVGFGVMILKDNKILLGKRHEDPEKADSLLNGAGTWTMPGGKLDFGESFEEGAIRETLEETGIKIKDIEVICLHNNMVETAQFVTIGLFVKDFEGEPQVLEPDEITKWQWFNLDNLPNPMYFPSTKIIKNYKEKKFYIKED